jgi:hypothetical protein
MTSRLRQIYRKSVRSNRRAHWPLHAPQQSTTSSQRHRRHIRIPQKHPSIHGSAPIKKISWSIPPQGTSSHPRFKPKYPAQISPDTFE